MGETRDSQSVRWVIAKVLSYHRTFLFSFFRRQNTVCRRMKSVKSFQYSDTRYIVMQRSSWVLSRAVLLKRYSCIDKIIRYGYRYQ